MLKSDLIVTIHANIVLHQCEKRLLMYRDIPVANEIDNTKVFKIQAKSDYA